MHRQGNASARERHSQSPTNNEPTSRNPRRAATLKPETSTINTASGGANVRSNRSNTINTSRTGIWGSTTAPFIMTKAQTRRRNTALFNSSNTIRTISPATSNEGPIVTSRTPGIFSYLSKPEIGTSRASSKRRFSTVESRNPSVRGSIVSSVAPFQPFSSSKVRERESLISSTDSRASNSAIQRYKRIRNRVSFAISDDEGKQSVSRVLASEKILPRIFLLMNWNELLPLRLVCKAWFETIESKASQNLGVIAFRSSAEAKMAIYNASSVTWNKFRFLSPIVFDMTRPVQNEFWSKHGPSLKYLEIQNRMMSLTGLVEILARCPKLEFFRCNWTPEMYSFNSDLIRKYYGIHFKNGTFMNLEQLAIDYSSSLTDNALSSILKWCGGSLKSLSLTSPPDEDILTRLKPRWSVESIRSYYGRFGYAGNLQYLDFSWSNLTQNDVRCLCQMDISLRGITLNYCKLDDTQLRSIIMKFGGSLELFKIEGTPFTDAIFNKEILPYVKILHIGGVKGNVTDLSFIRTMPHLSELSLARTLWLDHNMLLRPLHGKTLSSPMQVLDFSGGVKHVGNKNLDPNLNRMWFSDFVGLLTTVKELNLSQWTMFGTNTNFRCICENMHLLEKLVLRDWKLLSDVGTTGLFEEEIHVDWGDKMPQRPRIFVGSLQRLRSLDLSGTAITDASLSLALLTLKNIRTLAMDNTRVTDNGIRFLIDKMPSLDRISALNCLSVSTIQNRFRRADGRSVIFGKI